MEFPRLSLSEVFAEFMSDLKGLQSSIYDHVTCTDSAGPFELVQDKHGWALKTEVHQIIMGLVGFNKLHVIHTSPSNATRKACEAS